MITADAVVQGTLYTMPPRRRSNNSPQDDKIEILQAINEVSTTMVGFGKDMSYMRTRIDDLGLKIDRVETSKANSKDLEATERRFERTVAEMREDLSAKFARKIDRDDFNPAAFDTLGERVEANEDAVELLASKTKGWEDKAHGGWIVFCKVGLVLSAIMGAGAGVVHEVLAIAKGR